MKNQFSLLFVVLCCHIFVESTLGQTQQGAAPLAGKRLGLIPLQAEKANSPTAVAAPAVYPKLKRPSGVKSTQSVEHTISEMGESINPFTVSGTMGNRTFSYDPLTKTLLFCRRGGPNDPGGASTAPGNRLFFDLNTKDGDETKWQKSKGPAYDHNPHATGNATFGARYPFARLLNPTRSSDTAKLYGTFAASVLSDPAGSWGGITKGAQLVQNGSANMTVEPTGRYMIHAMGKNSNDEVFTVENKTIVIGGGAELQYQNELLLSKGVVNPANQQITWTSQTISLPSVSPDHDYQFAHAAISFSPNSPIGYITLTARLKDTIRCPLAHYYPMVLVTMDNGATWTNPYVADPTYHPAFQAARFGLRGDSALNNQGILRKVAYSSHFEHDAAVDSLGNLHMFIGLSPSGFVGGSSEEIPQFSVVSYWIGYYDVIVNPATLAANAWNVVPLFKPQSFRGSVGDVSGVDNIFYDNRPTVSVSQSGKELVFGVYDTDTSQYEPNAAGQKNTNPDLWARALKIEDESYWLSRGENLTNGSNIGGMVLFGQLTDKFKKTGNRYTLFQSSALLSTFTGNTSNWPVTHLCDRIEWEPSNFQALPDVQTNGTYHTIRGKVFHDKNGNCQQDAGENGLAGRLVNVGNYYFSTSVNGDYYMAVLPGTYPIQFVPTNANFQETTPCHPNFTLPPVTVSGDTSMFVSGQNIAVHMPLCYMAKVSANYSLIRPCRLSNFNILVRNTGNMTVYNVRVSFIQPSLLKHLSSSIPLTYNAANQTYTGLIDSILQGGVASIFILDSVRCNAPMDASVCTPVQIRYDGSCTPVAPGWNGVDLEVKGFCTGPVPTFTIRNKGAAMAVPHPYKLYKDSLFVYQHTVLLGAGDSITFQVPNASPLSIYRVEVKQSQHHPVSATASANVHCGAIPLSNPPLLANADFSFDNTVACGTVRTSYDPNDKQVFPPGAGTMGKVLPSSWLEYKIRFMNKGNDTAFKVVVVDSLASDLDMSTFTEVMSSHPYRLTIATTQPPVLRFHFDNILLPDSITNTEGSRGYVTFRIRPKEATPLGTQIRNQAGIYFDFNPPVMTNYTLNTLFEPVLTPGIVDSVVIISSVRSSARHENLVLFPNPTKGRFSISGLVDGTVEVWNSLGAKLRSVEVAGNQMDVDISPYGKGMYWIRVRESSGVFTRKIVLE